MSNISINQWFEETLVYHHRSSSMLLERTCHGQLSSSRTSFLTIAAVLRFLSALALPWRDRCLLPSMIRRQIIDNYPTISWRFEIVKEIFHCRGRGIHLSCEHRCRMQTVLSSDSGQSKNFHTFIQSSIVGGERRREWCSFDRLYFPLPSRGSLSAYIYDAWTMNQTNKRQQKRKRAKARWYPSDIIRERETSVKG